MFSMIFLDTARKRTQKSNLIRIRYNFTIEELILMEVIYYYCLERKFVLSI